MIKMIRTITLLSFFFIFSGMTLILEAPLFAEQLKIVAVINDEVVTQAELDRAVAPIYLQMQANYSPEELAERVGPMRQRVLEQLVDERLMLQEAKDPRPIEVGKGKVGTPPPIEVPEEEIEEMLQNAKEKFPSEEVFFEALATQGVNEDSLRQRYQEQLTIQRLIDRECRYRVSVSPAEVTEFYYANREEFKRPPAVQVATILVRPNGMLDNPRARSEIKKLREQILAGESFYELAEKHSDGLNAPMGGRIGWLEQGRSRPEIDQALFALELGEVSEVIKTPAGFHLFLVESTREATQAELDEVQGFIRRQLLNQKAAKKYEDWIAKLRSEAYITLK